MPISTVGSLFSWPRAVEVNVAAMTKMRVKNTNRLSFRDIDSPPCDLIPRDRSGNGDVVTTGLPGTMELVSRFTLCLSRQIICITAHVYVLAYSFVQTRLYVLLHLTLHCAQ